MSKSDLEKKVVSDFGREWSKFDHIKIDSDVDHALDKTYISYFHMLDFAKLPDDAEGFDLGAGSGRWATIVAKQVGLLNCIEPSAEAIKVLRKKFTGFSNVKIHNASSTEYFLPTGSQDFGYCLGVLHHTEDIQLGLRNCANALKSGAPFLIYLYYDFENRSIWFKLMWRFSDVLRRLICVLPFKVKHIICDILALIIYWPLSRIAKLAENLGLNSSQFPLSFYRNKPLYMMRTDSLDRFGTRLEKRYSQKEITRLLHEAGFNQVVFSELEPFWVAMAYKV